MKNKFNIEKLFSKYIIYRKLKMPTKKQVKEIIENTRIENLLNYIMHEKLIMIARVHTLMINYPSDANFVETNELLHMNNIYWNTTSLTKFRKAFHYISKIPLYKIYNMYELEQKITNEIIPIKLSNRSIPSGIVQDHSNVVTNDQTLSD